MSQQSSMKKLPGVGELFSMSKELVMKRKEFFFTLAAVPAVVQLIGTIAMEVSIALFPVTIIAIILSVILAFLMSIGMTKAIADEKMTDWKKALSDAKPLFWPYLWATILVGLVTMIGFILFVIPGIYLSLLFSFYIYTMVLDGKKGWEAAEASKHLVKGSWWAVFGRLLGFVLPIMILAMVVGGVAAMTGSEIVIQVVSTLLNIVITPLGVAYSYFIYKHLKQEKGLEMKK